MERVVQVSGSVRGLSRARQTELLLAASARDPEEMWTSLKGYVELISDGTLRSLLTSILGDPDVAGRLRIAPAGLRIHHCVRSGLLEHIVSLCELAALFGERYPRLNSDWLIAGAILHDLGKIEELGTSRRLGYTARGQLVGHIALGWKSSNGTYAGSRAFHSTSRPSSST